jgi:hypothetical protein
MMHTERVMRFHVATLIISYSQQQQNYSSKMTVRNFDGDEKEEVDGCANIVLHFHKD